MTHDITYTHRSQDAYKRMGSNEKRKKNDAGIWSFDCIVESYRGYHYTIKQNDAYIQIEGGLVTKKYPSGDFNITIEDPDLKNVKAVYIKSKNREKHVGPF